MSVADTTDLYNFRTSSSVSSAQHAVLDSYHVLQRFGLYQYKTYIYVNLSLIFLLMHSLLSNESFCLYVSFENDFSLFTLLLCLVLCGSIRKFAKSLLV